ncbi:MAG: PqqD family protein [Pseudomonadota bacterium]
MLEVNTNAVYSLAKNIFLYKIKELDKFWVFNIDSGDHYSLNETSFWVIEQINGISPLEVILGKFLDTFDVDNKQREKDFFEIVERFLNEGIIKNGG